MGIVLGLLTALTWGGSDFIARFATQRIGSLRTMFYMQGFGFLLLTTFLLWFHQWGHLFDGSGAQPWAWGLIAGVANAVASFALYKAFEIGKLSVVAPLSASSPALTAVLSYLTGERLTLPRIIGIFCIVAGVMLIAGGEDKSGNDDPESARRSGQGIGWALLSAFSFGILFWVLGIRVVPRTGALAAVWLIRLIGIIAGILMVLIRRVPMHEPLGNTRWQLLGMAVLDTSAYIFNNQGLQLEQISVVSVLASLYGGVTVALAAVFLRENISKIQWLGIVAVFCGIFLISR